MPARCGKLLVMSVFQIKISAEITMDSFPDSCRQMLGSRGHSDLTIEFRNADDSFQWPVIAGLDLHIVNPVEEVLPMLASKAARERDETSNRTCACQQASGAPPAMPRGLDPGVVMLPDSVLKNESAFRAY